MASNIKIESYTKEEILELQKELPLVENLRPNIFEYIPVLGNFIFAIKTNSKILKCNRKGILYKEYVEQIHTHTWSFLFVFSYFVVNYKYLRKAVNNCKEILNRYDL